MLHGLNNGGGSFGAQRSLGALLKTGAAHLFYDYNAIGASTRAPNVVISGSRLGITNAGDGEVIVNRGRIAAGVFSLDVTSNPIVVNAALGNIFQATLTGSRQFQTPTNLIAGQRITLRITQGGSGGYAVTFDSGYKN